MSSLTKSRSASRWAKQVKSLIKPFEKAVGKRFVLSQPEELAVCDCDACTLVKHPPDVVVIPRTTEEVAKVVALCHKHGVPFIARGAGTGLSGGALSIEGGVMISLARMDQILAVDPEGMTATVETGVVNAWLNRELAPHGLFYAPDPSSQSASTLGGNIAENAGGIHCIKYGVTVDHILALEVVLPDGRVTWLGSKNRRHHGMNLTGLFVGSEGTLGIATKAVVRVLPKPQATRVYLAAFKAVNQATDTVASIITSQFVPAALEFMDAFTVKAVNQAFDVGFPEDCAAVLLIELAGTDEQISIEDDILQSILTEHNVMTVKAGETEEERQKLWQARKGAVAAYGRFQPAFYLHDSVIPRSELTNILSKIEAISQKYDMTVGNVFHAGDGNLHPNILFDPSDPDMVETVMQGGEEILQACLDVGGTLSGEHGIGLEKSGLMTRVFSETDLQKMTQIKTVFDDSGVANPSKVFPIRTGCGENKMAMTHQMLVSASRDKTLEDIWI